MPTAAHMPHCMVTNGLPALCAFSPTPSSTAFAAE
eukprot:CAMPEP_0119149948 /NCGR_PEP_ID=MMETSP1310-20130426/44092_1 /TAXON_ID=464262 /ORGANISM="Genus nov. species nov., Strain RCC2339" /LENGTH=34 /DNA_ID= /DNA_START= /DNA_END= /DNA_ORIENTATION=